MNEEFYLTCKSDSKILTLHYYASFEGQIFYNICLEWTP